MTVRADAMGRVYTRADLPLLHKQIECVRAARALWRITFDGSAFLDVLDDDLRDRWLRAASGPWGRSPDDFLDALLSAAHVLESYSDTYVAAVAQDEP